MVVPNITALKLLLSKTTEALPSLPVNVSQNKIVIIDLKTVKNDWQDDHCWNKTRAPKKKTYQVVRNSNEDIMDIRPSSSSLAYSVERHRYTHVNSSDFHRLVVTAQSPDGKYIPFALVQYRFDEEEHPVKNRPHGNSKHKQRFIPTKKSTLEKLTVAVKSQCVKRAVHEVEIEVGGLLSDSAAALPRNSRQASYLKSKNKASCKADPMSALLHMQLEEEVPFIRSITVDKNSPVVILFSDEQLKDIQKFCCNEEGPNTPFCVDMTFNLGNFYVVVTTYRHLQLVTKRSDKEPVILGPVMLCMKKDRATYQSLFQKIISHCPDIKHSLKAYGTDAENALRQALELEFPFTVGFICRTHIVRNLEHKLKSELFLSNKFFRMIIADIFGNKTQEGLVHCKSRQEYDLLLSKLQVKWDREEIIEQKKNGKEQGAKASKYFMKNKADVVYRYCRGQALSDAGIEVDIFDNNDPESINSLIKKWEANEKKDIATFVTDIKALHDKQRHDVKGAFCGISGLYTIKEEYEEFAASTDFWDLDQVGKKKYLDKVAEIPMITLSTKEDPLHAIDLLSGSFLPGEIFSLKAKAQRILNGNIRLGFSGPKSRIVCSDSGLQPHVVSAVGNNSYKCDSSCMHFKTHKICSHTLATAAENKDLHEYVNCFISKNISHNITPISHARGNKFAGRKPGESQRVRKRKNKVVDTHGTRSTLGETLRDVQPDFSHLQYQTRQHEGLRMVLTRVCDQRPPKPSIINSDDQPFQLLEIRGNIRKCFGCGSQLVDGPPKYSTDNFDATYCLRHKQHDHFYSEKYGKWLPKFENKHFHMARECVLRKNARFDASAVEISLDHTITPSLKNFLALRL